MSTLYVSIIWKVEQYPYPYISNNLNDSLHLCFSAHGTEVESVSSTAVMEAPIATELASTASECLNTDEAKEATSFGKTEDAQKMAAAWTTAPLISIDETVMVSASIEDF